MRNFFQRQGVERAEEMEVSQRIKAYKFEMKRISGTLEHRTSLKWTADRADRNSNQLIFSQRTDEMTQPSSDDFADNAILRTLYRRGTQ